MEVSIGGHVEPGFAAVKDAFTQNFEAGHETGAAFCLHVEGRKVVDLYGGSFYGGSFGGGSSDGERGNAEDGRPYDQDTLQLVFSTTKGATAACANLLVQRGELDLESPVARYWPEFAQFGKEEIPVLFLLSHQAGLRRGRHAEPGRGPGLGPGNRCPRSAAAVVGAGHRARLSRPDLRVVGRRGHTSGHRALPGHVLRRGDRPTSRPRVLDRTARRAGTPGLARDRRRSSRGRGRSSAGSGLFLHPVGAGAQLRRAFSEPGWANRRDWHAAEVPAVNGITNAVSLSRLYAALIGTVEGGPTEPILTKDQVDQARIVRTFGADQVFASVGFTMEEHIGQGFWLSSPFSLFGGVGSFGHTGAGGSYGFADPENGLAVGYVMNKMSTGMTVDPRSRPLVRASYEAVGAIPKYL
jgi:CubicO group peptidase (beta-lactamase class C family)